MSAITTGTAQQRLEPLGVGETLDRAIGLYRSNAVTLWKIVAAVIVPLSILEFVVERIAYSNGFVIDGQLYYSGGSSSTLAVSAASLIRLLAELIATGAVFKAVLDVYLGRGADWRESLGYARQRLGSLIWLGILWVVLVAIGFVLIVVPGIYLFVSFSVAVPVLMLEDVRGLKALQRSGQLVQKRWWATAARLLAAFLLYVVLVFIVGLIGGLLNRGLSIGDVTLWVLIQSLVSAVVAIFLAPFYSTVIAVVYVDLRVRKEALDIEMLSASLSPGERGLGTGGSDPAAVGASTFGAPPASGGQGGSLGESVPPPSPGGTPPAG